MTLPQCSPDTAPRAAFTQNNFNSRAQQESNPEALYLKGHAWDSEALSKLTSDVKNAGQPMFVQSSATAVIGSNKLQDLNATLPAAAW